MPTLSHMVHSVGSYYDLVNVPISTEIHKQEKSLGCDRRKVANAFQTLDLSIHGFLPACYFNSTTLYAPDTLP